MTAKWPTQVNGWCAFKIGKWAFAPCYHERGIGDMDGEWRRIFPGWYRLVALPFEGRP